jgi:4-hydroxybenzoate-CoA ligase
MPEETWGRRPYNAASEFIDAHVVHGHGDKVAFIESTRTATYAELQARSCQLARALRDMGLRQETRIALLLPDTVDYPVAFFGAIRAGFVVVPLNTFLPAERHAYILADSRARAIIVAAPFAAALRPLLARLPHLSSVVLVGGDSTDKRAFAGHDVHLLDELLAAQPAEPYTAPTISDEVAFWLYTSGSTGDPKGVKHVHTSLMATARLYGQGVLGIRPDDVVFSAAKLFFAYGLGNAMSFPMSVGASSVLLAGRPTPDAVLDIMRRHRPTIFCSVPSFYASLLADKGLTRLMGSNRLRVCVSAGEALPAKVAERFRAVVGVDILDGIGSTEMLQTFLSNRPGDIRHGSTGKPVPGYDVKIVDEAGGVLGTGEIGELVVCGPSSGEGYWNQRDKSRRTFVGEWTYTGDKFFRDADGYYHYCGRTDDMFKVGGMWVSPFEVEAALVTHEAVLEAAVIGKDDVDGLTKPKAFVVLKTGYVADDRLLESLKILVKERAGPWKYPRWIDIRPDLPRTATGKIQRFLLRDQESGTPVRYPDEAVSGVTLSRR